MPRFVPSVNETVDRVLSEVGAELQVKTAARREPAKTESLPPLKKIAQALRADSEPALTYDVLHVVKLAMMEDALGPLPLPELSPETGDSYSRGLRKIANELKLEDHRAHEALLVKGAHALKASRGLMLLRELVRE
jgi:hypothetical protein